MLYAVTSFVNILYRIIELGMMELQYPQRHAWILFLDACNSIPGVTCSEFSSFHGLFVCLFVCLFLVAEKPVSLTA